MQIQADVQTKIKGILDPEQKTQYEHMIELRNSQASRRAAMEAARRAQMRQNAPGGAWNAGCSGSFNRLPRRLRLLTARPSQLPTQRHPRQPPPHLN